MRERKDEREKDCNCEWEWERWESVQVPKQQFSEEWRLLFFICWRDWQKSNFVEVFFAIMPSQTKQKVQNITKTLVDTFFTVPLEINNRREKKYSAIHYTVKMCFIFIF